MDPMPNHVDTSDLERELAWLEGLIEASFKRYFDAADGDGECAFLPAPALDDSRSPYAGLVRHYGFGLLERAALILALTPLVRPALLDCFFTRNRVYDRRFTELGGIHDQTHGHFIPTAETLAFILGGTDLGVRLAVQSILHPDHVFNRHGILAPQRVAVASSLKCELVVSEDYLGLATTGEAPVPVFGSGFPARLIDTALDWEDLVLHPATRRQLDDILAWTRHGDTLLVDWGMAGRLRPGYRALFYGPPGTGKTLTACLLGRTSARPVYRVDLSLVVSKYIGETEKNLALVFDKAEHKHWILFFDEADALFGRRSETRDAHDRYANQETAFLLQRIETFDGMAILASNQRQNMDEAFSRRFESVIHFPMPRAEERLALWQRGLPSAARLDPAISLQAIATEHPMSGGAIMNVIRHACIRCLDRGDQTILANDLIQGVRREQAKEGHAPG